MQMPDEDEYGEILARIGGAMIYSCQELELLYRWSAGRHLTT